MSKYFFLIHLWKVAIKNALEEERKRHLEAIEEASVNSRKAMEEYNAEQKRVRFYNLFMVCAYIMQTVLFKTEKSPVKSYRSTPQ